MNPRESLERRLKARCARDPLIRGVREEAEISDASVALVGGYVRDVALGRRPVDVDLVAWRRSQALLRSLRRRWGRQGFRFRKRGITTYRFRIEGRDVDVVTADRRGLEADLARREFTVNAVAYDLRSGRVHDPYHGLRDLGRGRLRRPRPGVVLEDPVRALRAARFVSELPPLRPDGPTEEEIRRAAPRLRRAPAERVRDEWNRLLLGKASVQGIRAAEAWAVLDATLPELAPMRTCAPDPELPSVWEHTVAVLEAAAKPARIHGLAVPGGDEDRLALRWAALLHDVAKPETLDRGPGGRPTFHGHETSGARQADRILRRLKQPRRLRERVRRLVQLHLRPHLLAQAGAPERGMRRLAREAGEDLPLLLLLAAADARGWGDAVAPRGRRRALRRTLEALARVYNDSLKAAELPPLLRGDDLLRLAGRPPGPWVGELLAELRELQASGRIRTREEAEGWVGRVLSNGEDRERASRTPALHEEIDAGENQPVAPRTESK